MSLSSDRRSFSTRYSDASDKILLVSAFLLGIGGSIGLKLAGLPIFFPALFSGLVIILYAILTYFSRSARLEPDQIGDNAYYLGFVLTLSSLSYTLYELGSQDAESVFIAQVISGFGIALSSTIVGVATRVLLIQFRVDLVAREREARLTLNDAMRSFRSEMADAIRGTKYLGSEIRQSLEEHHVAIAASQEARMAQGIIAMVDAFKASLEGFLTEARATQQALVEASRSAIGVAENNTITTLNRIEESLALAVVRISESTLALAKATEDGIATNQDAFERQFAATLDFAKTAEEVFTSSREVLGRQIAASSALQEAANRSAVNSAENLSTMVSGVLGKAAAESAETQKALVETSRSAIDTAEKNTTQMLKRIEDSLALAVVRISESTIALAKTADEGLTSSRVSFERQITANSALQEAANRSAVSSAENLSTMVGKAAAEAGLEVQAAQDEVAQTTATLREGLGALKADVVDFSKMVRSHARALARMQIGQNAEGPIDPAREAPKVACDASPRPEASGLISGEQAPDHPGFGTPS